MASGDNSPNLDPVEEDIKDMRIKSGNSSDNEHEDTMADGNVVKRENGRSHPASPVKQEPSSGTASPRRSSHSPHSYDGADDSEQVVGGDISIQQEAGKPPKLKRKGSQKVVAKPPRLFFDHPDATAEACKSFSILAECTYASKALGASGLHNDDNDCDCAEEWDGTTKSNLACGEDSDCINRATKLECVGDCGCGAQCQNRRIQLRQYADIAIIKTEKKGYGVRTNKDLVPNQFIFEYIGEVIKESQFRKRMIEYDEEGFEHLYFMSLNKTDFVDATRKGNLGRFCNHSCNPNCYVDKWVVGEKLRMGIFAERSIAAGEELVFNYNVDRYGAKPQPCYCGEPNCVGFIGGKTQTDRSTKLSLTTIEALGIDDGGGWDSSVARRPRKKRAGEDDEEYVDSLQPRSLDEEGVTKVMATLMQNKEKWITVKLLGRIQLCEDASVRGRVVRMHGYQIMKTVLNEFKDDVNVVLQVLQILDSFPRVTRNKIADSKIEDVVATLEDHSDERVAELSQRLLKEWAALEVAYRIPRIKRDPEAIKLIQQKRLESERRERRRRTRSRSRTRSPPADAPKGPSLSAPTGPKAQFTQFQRPFKYPRAPPGPLPQGWYTNKSEGRTYYYDDFGHTSWVRPTMPAVPPPPKPAPQENELDKIINEITSQKAREAEAKASTAATPQSEKKEKADKKPKWMSFDEAKKNKLYRTTLSPHVEYIANKYKHKLPKDEIKRHFRDILKFLADSDFRKGRVQDPTVCSEKQEKGVKKHTKEYLDKAVVKYNEHEKKKKAKEAAREQAKKDGKPVSTPDVSTPLKPERKDGKEESDDDVVMDLSEDEDVKGEVSKTITPATPLEQINGESLKRKRQPELDANGLQQADSLDTSPNKRARSATPPPPPPPPPPPAEDMPESEEATPVMDTSQHGWQEEGANGKTLASTVQDQGHFVEEDERDYGDDFTADTSHAVET